MLAEKSVSRPAIICCLVITMGYFLGLDQEGLAGGISMQGIMYGVLSSCCVSLNSIYTKKVLPFVDDSVWALNYYNNLNASLLFIPLMFIFGELPHTVFVTQMTDVQFWLLMSLGGVMGVLIGFVTGMQIKVCNFLIQPEVVSKNIFSPFIGNISAHPQHIWDGEGLRANSDCRLGLQRH